jgi:hypothetical protein
MATSNYDMALKAEAKKVIRCFHRYDTDTISRLYARVGNPSRDALNKGVFFYTHPDCPGIAFNRRFEAARAALRQS